MILFLSCSPALWIRLPLFHCHIFRWKQISPLIPTVVTINVESDRGNCDRIYNRRWNHTADKACLIENGSYHFHFLAFPKNNSDTHIDFYPMRPMSRNSRWNGISSHSSTQYWSYTLYTREYGLHDGDDLRAGWALGYSQSRWTSRMAKR